MHQRQQCAEDGLAIPRQADVGRVAQADAGGVGVDLDAFGLAGFGALGALTFGGAMCGAGIGGMGGTDEGGAAVSNEGMPGR